MNRISFIIHGKHRQNGKLISDISDAFGHLFNVSFSFTEYHTHAIPLSKDAAATGADCVIAVGGDGTLNEVVNGIIQSGSKNVCLGLLPCGTGNDFAKTLGATNNIALLKQAIEQNAIRKIDLGLVSFKDTNGADAERYFINIADTGMGGYIAQKITSYSKWMGATLTFQRAILTTFFSYKKKNIKVEADTFKYGGKLMSLVIANGKYFGSGMGIAPDAKPDDGSFSVVVAADISLWDYLKNLPTIRKCEKISHPEVAYHTAKELSVSSDEQMPIDMDGEFIGFLPMQIKVVPGAVSFLIP